MVFFKNVYYSIAFDIQHVVCDGLFSHSPVSVLFDVFVIVVSVLCIL